MSIKCPYSTLASLTASAEDLAERTLGNYLRAFLRDTWGLTAKEARKVAQRQTMAKLVEVEAALAQTGTDPAWLRTPLFNPGGRTAVDHMLGGHVQHMSADKIRGFMEKYPVDWKERWKQ